MPSVLPDGEPAPPDGRLPETALAGLGTRPFGLYLHVPFCAVRCGYCDFNTYTAIELGSGASQATYSDTAAREIELAARALGNAPGGRPQIDTVFFGGGTPTLLPPEHLIARLAQMGELFGLTPDVEITVEANPDSVTPASLATLAAGGVTRVSFGLQSAVPHVLRTLDRTHDPDRIPQVLDWARAAGLAVSLDLIYGTPGESLADWEVTLDAAVRYAPDHISAYALVVEAGTKLAARVARGDLARPDDDDEATKYELAETVLAQGGWGWYEISNWARTPADVCRHNLGYWRDGDWWGVGPGAHSHVGGVRWWNVKHPTAYAARLDAGVSPAQAREQLTASQQLDERVLLGVRLAEGLPVATLPDRSGLAGLIADGLVDGPAALRGRVVLTLRGRLLADTVVTTLLA